jgi:Flp pilus assembly protein TadD/4-amino-4-deoxy-L-arabinose transferase-like glycosyltransferase
MGEAPPKTDDRGKLAGFLRSRLAVLLVVFLGALAVRLVHLAADSSSPFFNLPGVDAKRYYDDASGFAKGTWPAPRAFSLRPPGYAFFLGSVHKVFGPGIGAAKVVQMFLGALSCLLCFLLAERLLHNRRQAIVAAAICALHGLLVFYEGQLLSGGLDLFLTVLLLWLLVVAESREGLLLWGLAGVVLGLNAANRGWTLALFPLVVVWILLAPGWRRQTEPTAHAEAPAVPWKRRVLRALVLGAGLLVPLTPIAWHNAKYDSPVNPGEAAPSAAQVLGRLASGKFVLLANGNVNLYLGNSYRQRHYNDALYKDANHFSDFHRLNGEPEKLLGLRSASEKNAYFRRKTLEEIAGDPGHWVLLVLQKGFQYFSGVEIPRNMMFYAHRQYSPVLSALLWKRGIAFPSGLLIPLGLVGLALMLREWRRYFLLFAVLTAHFGFVLLYFVTARYRMPVLPIFAVAAALAVFTLVDRFRERAPRKLVAPLLLLLAALVICNSRIGAMTDRHTCFEYNLVGTAEHERGNYAKAIEWYRQALAENPTYSEAHHNLAMSEEKLGNWQEAEAEYLQAIAADPEDAVSFRNLGTLKLLQRRPEEGARFLEKAVALEPESTEARFNLVTVYYKMGNYAGAVEQARYVVKKNPADPQAHHNLGAALMQLGKLEEALPELLEALRLDPQSELTRRKLAELEALGVSSGAP